MAGYSKKSLIEKLGIKPGYKIFVTHEPEKYWKELGKLPDEVVVTKKLTQGLNFIHYFTASTSELQKYFSELKKCLLLNGILWISWPKKSSKINTDVHESIVREIGLASGLVDVKICAVDEVWSGLKFVYRLKDR